MTLPVSDVEAVTTGEFLFDRHAQLQLSVMTTNGDVVLLAHQGFDPRPHAPQEIAKTPNAQRSHTNKSQTFAQQADDPGDAP